MRLEELLSPQEEQIDEGIKSALASTAIALIATMSPMAASNALAQDFTSLSKAQVTQIATLSQKALAAEMADYKERHNMSANDTPDARATAYIKARAQERVSQYLSSQGQQGNTTAMPAANTNKQPMAQRSEVRTSSNARDF